MNKIYKKFTLLVLCSFLTLQISAQSFEWKASSFQQRLTPTHQHFDFELIANDAEHQKIGQLTSIALPDPTGEAVEFELTPAQVMSPALAAKFPSIKTYDGRSKNGESLKLTLSNKGIHAMVFSNDGLYFIDPIEMKASKKHQAYYKRDMAFNADKADFQEIEPIIYDKEKFARVKKIVAEKNYSRPPSGTELRTYRIAIAATGEYTSFHGGTVTDGMAAIVVTMARVNGIYEREVATTMVLVDNNDELIFTDAASDPFTNNSAGAYIDEVQARIDQVIGAANYDIGHGFSTGAGGLAGLGVVCQEGRKGSGVTGTNSPIGDPYDVDYVAHEIGHQFGGPHTFNGVNGSCAGGNRSGNTAYEPGSGVTIMAYAGICGADNTANNSIPFFHASSLEYITVFSQEAGGNSCASITATGNTPPEVEAGAGGFTIPVNTPFQLNGSATDVDGDNLTYAWEQFDLGPAGTPNSPSGNAPLFRSFVPTTDSFRVFPRLADIINNTQTIGEILPSYARDMSFILTVRDDQAVGGVNNDLISFSVSDVGGPFVVDAVDGTFSGLENITINWDVANTNLSPINCTNVDIYISDNEGATFDYLVIENTPNDGSQVITLPNITATNVKVMVAANQNIFFNIAPGTLSINEATEPTFTMATSFVEESYCPDDLINIDIASQSVLGFDQPITLSIANLDAAFSGTFSNSTINPGESTSLQLENLNGASGAYEFELVGNAGGIEKSVMLSLVVTNNPEIPVFVAPNASAITGLQPTFEWNDDNLLTTYDLQVASDQAFSNIVQEINDIADQTVRLTEQLESTTTYFARLSAKNTCGVSDFAMLSFTTDEVSCSVIGAADLPITIDTTPTTISSFIEVGATGTLESIEVMNVQITHSYIQDLTLILESPSGLQVILLSEVCGGDPNMNISFSDLTGADPNTIPCPPTNGEAYTSEEPLSTFFGDEINGTWTLTVIDGYNLDGGSLDNWELNICASGALFPPSAPSALAVDYQSDLEVLLSWSDNSDDEDRFEIFRSTSEETDYQKIAEVSSDIIEYTDVLPTVESTYYYKVLAASASGNSSFSNIVNINGAEEEAVNKPNNLIAQYVEAGTVRLTWDDNSNNEKQFFIERAITSEANFILIDSVNANEISIETELPSFVDRYQYRVFANNDYVVSDYSNIVNASIQLLSNKAFNETNISIFPNPAEKRLNIQNNGTLKVISISITDLSGKLMSDIPVNAETVDLTGFEPGLYIISFQTNDNLFSTQLIIK